MDKSHFKIALHEALVQEYIDRETVKTAGYTDERVHWIATMHADMGVNELLYNLDVPAIRDLILEYYNG